MAEFELPDLVHRLNMHIDLAMHHHRRYDSYYSGKQVLAALPPSVLRDCGDRMPRAFLNFGRLVVDSLEERIDVAGFQHRDEDVSAEIWHDYWQRNDLDEVSQQIHLESLIHGRAYAFVWIDKQGYPRITGESSRRCTVWQLPGSNHRIAALRRWIEPDGTACATLYEPHRITKWKTPSKISMDPYLSPEALMNPTYDAYSQWDFSQLPSTGWIERAPEIPNPLGVVPIVPFVNKRRLMNPAGESELNDVIPILDCLNKLLTDLMVSSEFSAMPRRFATGIELTTKVNPDTGEEEVVNPFSRDPGRLWMSEAEGAAFGQFPEVSLTNYRDSMFALIQHLGAIAGLPAHYTGIAREPASADAVRSSEAPLVRKAQRRQKVFGGAWEDVIRLADVIRHGLKRPGMDQLECVWADAESRTLAAAADAAGKLAQIGVPLPQLAEDLGYSPTEIQKIAGNEVLAGVNGNGAAPPAAPPDSPETQRETRREGEVSAR
jgi:hypothetical protein